MEKCGICLCTITKNYVYLECNHVFHYKCIDSWLNKNLSCPYCRQQCDIKLPDDPIELWKLFLVKTNVKLPNEALRFAVLKYGCRNKLLELFYANKLPLKLIDDILEYPFFSQEDIKQAISLGILTEEFTQDVNYYI